MSLAYNLVNSLTPAEIDEDITTLVIDHYTRTINIPKGITTLGVESDDDVLRLNFKMPRYLNTVDLYNFSIRVNYINANGEDDVYKVTDKAIVGNNITFSWLVGPTATAYKGNTRFNVCMVITDSDSVVKQEYNTAVASLPVKEGLECSERVISEYTDILEQWERRLFGIGDTEEAKLTAASEAQQTAIVNKGAEVLATIPADYTSAVKMADEGVRTKADAIICSADGELIRVSDASNDNLRGLKIFGKTTQVKTTGKNLLPITSPSRTSGGITYTVQEDGGIYVSGTSTSNSWFNTGGYKLGDNELAYIPAGTYILSGNSEPDITGYINGWYADGTAILQYNDTGVGGCLVTFSQDAYIYYQIMVAPDVTVDTVIYPQLELGSTATAYEPYTGGIPAPNPEYPQELVSIENPTVNICGKNLVDFACFSGSDNYIALVNVSDLRSVKKGKQYTLSVYLHATAETRAYWNKAARLYGYLEFDVAAGTNRYTYSFTAKADGDLYEVVSNVVNKYPTSDDVVVSALNAQLEFGDKATEYEPYKVDLLPITTPSTLPGIPVTSGGNYTDENGRQWICDEIDFERGAYVQRVNAEVFDGSDDENWYLQYASSNPILEISPAYDKKSIDGLCTHYTATKIVSAGTAIGYSTTGSGITLRFRPDDFATITLDEWKNRLSVSPITALYVLATPIETPLTADELAAFQALKSNYPNTTVLNDAGAWMNLRYNADTETWITNLIDEKIAAAVAKL